MSHLQAKTAISTHYSLMEGGDVYGGSEWLGLNSASATLSIPYPPKNGACLGSLCLRMTVCLAPATLYLCAWDSVYVTSQSSCTLCAQGTIIMLLANIIIAPYQPCLNFRVEDMVRRNTANVTSHKIRLTALPRDFGIVAHLLRALPPPTAMRTVPFS
ncbi:hypothetical protein BDD12DRAFT_325226 [Trichophaea hybrida]|nr:hypothetical protein BDD12DRAFT_325226 [Trichophaea hybrida]